MFIEAMADAAVSAEALALRPINSPRPGGGGAPQKWCWRAGSTQGALKDMVCSPGGTTIEAVRVLEEKGFRSAVIEAITQCMEKSEKLEPLLKLSWRAEALEVKNKGARALHFFRLSSGGYS